jgi:hypothetical protein
MCLPTADKHVPLITRKVRSQHTPWLTSEIKKLMNHRDYLKHKATRTKSLYFFEAYKIVRNKTNKNNSNNPKQLWKSVNLIRGKGSKQLMYPL